MKLKWRDGGGGVERRGCRWSGVERCGEWWRVVERGGESDKGKWTIFQHKVL